MPIQLHEAYVVFMSKGSFIVEIIPHEIPDLLLASI